MGRCAHPLLLSPSSLTLLRLRSCQMGVKSSTSVVDPRGRVWDTKGLYVADAVRFQPFLSLHSHTDHRRRPVRLPLRFRRQPDDHGSSLSFFSLLLLPPELTSSTCAEHVNLSRHRWMDRRRRPSRRERTGESSPLNRFFPSFPFVPFPLYRCAVSLLETSLPCSPSPDRITSVGVSLREIIDPIRRPSHFRHFLSRPRSRRGWD